MMNSNESRRYFLKVFGASFVGLPFLEYFNAPAYGATAPMRYLIMHAGCSLGRDTENHMFNPAKTGFGYDLPPGMSVLKDPTMGKSLFGAGFKGDPALISMISNLSIPMVASPNNQKCESSQSFHSAPLTCSHAAETGLLNGGSIKFAGTTSDNIIHPLISASGQPLVNTRVQVEGLGRANSQGTDGNRAFISWKEAKPNFIETQPSAIFDRFFTGVVAPGPTTDPMQADTYGAYMRARKKSLLDLTLSQSQALKGRLGSADKSRLELFETGFRELEKDLANLDTMQKPGATMGGSPTEVAQKVGYDSKNLGFNPTAQGPGGYYRFEKERAQAWARLWALLFGADKVRAGTHQITWAQSFLDLDNITGQTDTTVHDVMHNAGGQGVGKGGSGGDPRPTLNWHVASLSTLASLLKELPEGAGSVLDNTAIVMVFDGGFGIDADIQQFAPGASGSHSTDNMVALVAGGAGGLAQGVHLKAPNGTQPAHVILNAMKSVGYTGNTFGKLTQVDIAGLKK